MAGAPEIAFRGAGFTRRVRALLSRIDGFDGVSWRWLRRRVDGKAAFVMAGYAGRRMVMAMVLSRIETKDGPELLIEAAGGNLPSADLTMAGLTAAENIAAGAGLRGVRYSTLRPGLARKTQLRGYELVEVVMRRAVT